MRVSVIGAGSWGTTVAALCAQNVPTTLWCRSGELSDQINAEHVNGRYLEGYPLPAALTATHDLEQAAATADVLVMGVPSHGFRAVLHEAAQWVRPWVPIVSLSKGFEADTLQRMSEVAADELPGHPVGVLTGPNLAKEIMSGHPAASVVAIPDEHVASELQKVFGSEGFRVYTNPDVTGCEIGGALKNVIALAVGMSDGIGFGDNTRAALITRGLNELTRLGVALGGDPLTFLGLAGMGDLIATCTSPQSRNRHVGEQLGKGRSLPDIIEDMSMVAEGVKSAPSVRKMAEQLGVVMPIAEEVASVCIDGRTITEMWTNLLAREIRPELEGLR